MTPKTPKIIGYVRVSTDEQAASGLSLEAQEAKLRQYCKLYNLDLVDVITDAGVSAKTLDRPGLELVLAKLERKEVDGLLVAKLDRLTRSVADLGKLIEAYFSERKGYRLLAVDDQIDTKTAGGRLVLNVLASVSQWEREVISERTRTAFEAKRARGERWGKVPLGYQVAADGKTLIEHEGEQSAIRRILELRAAGVPIRKIADQLNAEEIPSRAAGWHASTVQNVLARSGRSESASVSVDHPELAESVSATVDHP